LKLFIEISINHKFCDRIFLGRVPLNLNWNLNGYAAQEFETVIPITMATFCFKPVWKSYVYYIIGAGAGGFCITALLVIY